MNLQAVVLVATGVGALAGGVLLGRRVWRACALLALVLGVLGVPRKG